MMSVRYSKSASTIQYRGLSCPAHSVKFATSSNSAGVPVGDNKGLADGFQQDTPSTTEMEIPSPALQRLVSGRVLRQPVQFNRGSSFSLSNPVQL